VQSDKAIVSVSVRTEDKLLETALRNNQELRGKIVASLVQHGLKNDQIKASQFSQTPKYGMFGDKAKSYVVENTIKITVQNEKEFQAVARVVDSGSEVRYLGVEFEQTDKVIYKTKALSEACDKATEKRKLLESKFGFKLVPVKMTEGVRLTAPATPIGRYGGGYVSSVVSKRAVGVTEIAGMHGEAEAAAVDDGGSTFGELVYKAEVTVDYQVEKGQ
jgi:uncharacterized protein YggE